MLISPVQFCSLAEGVLKHSRGPVASLHLTKEFLIGFSFNLSTIWAPGLFTSTVLNDFWFFCPVYYFFLCMMTLLAPWWNNILTNRESAILWVYYSPDKKCSDVFLMTDKIKLSKHCCAVSTKIIKLPEEKNVPKCTADLPPHLPTSCFKYE